MDGTKPTQATAKTGLGMIMSRRILPLFACLVLVLFANTAHSASISNCTLGANIHCNFNENGATSGTVNPLTDGAGVFPDWLVGYTFLLEPGTTYNGVADNGNVSDVVVIHSGFAEIFSELDPSFVLQRTNALALAAIDGTALSDGQIVGAAFFPGAQQFGGIGLVNENASGVADLANIFFTTGGGDSITITSAPPVTGVPEPTTLTLLLVGSLGLGLCFRHSRQSA